MLTCPHCQGPFEYTWRQYFKNGLGKFNCPLCRAHIKASVPFAIVATSFVITSVLFSCVLTMALVAGKLGYWVLALPTLGVGFGLITILSFNFNKSILRRFPPAKAIR